MLELFIPLAFPFFVPKRLSVYIFFFFPFTYIHLHLSVSTMLAELMTHDFFFHSRGGQVIGINRMRGKA